MGREKAIEDFGAAAKGMKVEVVFADHQNKPDIGSNVVRQWFDVDKVDVVVDVPTSSVALAVNTITKEKNKVFLVSGAAASDLTGKACSPNTVHWTYDTWALANGTGNAIVKTGGNTWFFLTADYAFGHALERDTAAVVEKSGGKVVGNVRHPFRDRTFHPSCCRRSIQGQDHRSRQCRRRSNSINRCTSSSRSTGTGSRPPRTTTSTCARSCSPTRCSSASSLGCGVPLPADRLARGVVLLRRRQAGHGVGVRAVHPSGTGRHRHREVRRQLRGVAGSSSPDIEHRLRPGGLPRRGGAALRRSELGGMNVFFVYDDGSLVTPPLTGTILPGITRDSVMTLAPSQRGAR